jgi:hypothetical protein
MHLVRLRNCATSRRAIIASFPMALGDRTMVSSHTDGMCSDERVLKPELHSVIHELPFLCRGPRLPAPEAPHRPSCLDVALIGEHKRIGGRIEIRNQIANSPGHSDRR